MKKKVDIVIVIIISVFLLIWIVDIARIEIRTLRHGHEFAVEIDRQSNEYLIFGEIEHFRVLEYSRHFARVYLVCRGWQGGLTGSDLRFEQTNFPREWTMTHWDVFWSEGGSLDDFMWPYLWHSSLGRIIMVVFIIFPILILLLIRTIVAVIVKKVDKRKRLRESEEM